MPLVIDTQSDPQNLWKSSEIVGDFRFIFTNHIKVSWLFISCQNIFFRPVCMTQYHGQRWWLSGRIFNLLMGGRGSNSGRGRL